MTFLIRSALALAPAVLLGLYASYPMLAFVPWIALVPWVVLYTAGGRERVPWSWYFAGAYLAWILQYPQAWKFGWYAPLVMGLACISWWLPFAPLLARLHRTMRLPRSLAAALAWTSVEWLRATFTVANFDLYRVGYSQARFPVLVQFADLVGVYGVTFLIAAVNGWLADWILTARERGWMGSLRAPSVKWGAAAILASIALVSAYGSWRLSRLSHETGPRLALVQPNLPHSAENALDVHLAHVLITDRGVAAGVADLIVWPENAILDDIRRDGAYLEDLGILGRRKGAWFVVGALASRPERPGLMTNGAWLVDPEGTVRGEYHKQILFPWSEYIPADAFLGRWLPGLQRHHRSITRLAWGFHPPGTPGGRMEILELPWRGRTVRIAPLICVENTYPPLPASAGRLGADFFLNITSEGLVGGPVQEQLLRIAMLRAIENRMAYVRVGNTGISAVIDSGGRTTAILRGANGNTINTEGIILTDVPISRAPRTVYARSHDMFVKSIVATTACLVLASFAGRFRRAAAAAVAALVLSTGCASPPSIDGSPNRVAENLDLGRRALASGRIAGAREPLSAACATEGGCREAIPLLVEAYVRSKQDDVAVILFESIASRYPTLRVEALASKAYFLERIHDLEAARDAYSAALEAAPSPHVYERLGRLLARMQRPDESVELLRSGLSRHPDHGPLRLALSRVLRERRDFEEAERIVAPLLFEEPNRAAAWSELGWIRLVRGDEAGAEEALRTAESLESAPTEARYLLAKLALRRGDMATFESMIREIAPLASPTRRVSAPAGIVPPS